MNRLSMLLFFVLLAFSSAFGKETLNLRFDRPQTVSAGDRQVVLEGEFTADGFWKYGKRGLSIPAADLVGEQGTILFHFRQGRGVEAVQVPRYLLTLRTRGRLTLNLYVSCTSMRLNYGFSDMTKNWFYTLPSSEKLDPGKSCWAGFSWDGDYFRIYRDGRMVAETRQPLPVRRVGNLNIGPFKDGWKAPKAWGDDSFAGQLVVHDRALSSGEIAAVCGIEKQSAARRFPPVLAVPDTTAGMAMIDGTLDHPSWKTAASLPVLIDGRSPAQSGRLPESGMRMTYDRQNLYVGFYSLFPREAPIKSGAVRTEKEEPEVWGTESFEFYLLIRGIRYRFGGNVAGGYTEGKGSDRTWNGAWTYRTGMKMRIDDRRLWQGTLAIPWKTLNLQGPPEEEFRMNFCRTWRLPEISTYSSQADGGNYGELEDFVRVRLDRTAPVLQLTGLSDVSQGTVRGNGRLVSGSSGKVDFQMTLMREDCTAVPRMLFQKRAVTVPGAVEDFVLSGEIDSQEYDRICYCLSINGRVVMRQLQPFRLNREYLSAEPRFLNEKIGVKIRTGLLKQALAAGHLSVRLLDSSGKIIFGKEVSGDSLEIHFPRTSAPGEYLIQLLESSGKVLNEKRMVYPGIGEWESVRFDQRIIPPFTPLTVKKNGNRLDCSVWNRVYSWRRSLLPSAIRTGVKELLLEPAALMIDGRAVAADVCRLEQSRPHRVDLKTGAVNRKCRVQGRSWLEYDGVQYSRFRLEAAEQLGQVSLRLVMPEDMAKYLHTSDATTVWGGKLTVPVKEGSRYLRFYPTIWLGMEDAGLCFFTETRYGWKSSPQKTCRLIRENGRVILEVFLADRLAAGESLDFEFGLLASPVRPLPADYPLNTFSWHWLTPLNRQGRTPASSCALVQSWYKGAIYSFSNLPPTAEQEIQQLRKNVDFVGRTGTRPVTYFCSRYLSDEYPEMKAYGRDWRIIPELSLKYRRNGREASLIDCCPRSGASSFFMVQLRDLLKKVPGIGGCYFDFGLVPVCSNHAHGCRERIPLLGMREFYRRVALLQLDAGIRQPCIVLHNTDAVQLPAMTFATHLFNGEHIRQHSSAIMHGGKDILDTYDVSMFACELSTLPFGITNSVYQSNDILLPEFGGGKEDPELYKFRITKAMLAGALPHNTMVALNRCHYGIFDKILRIYEDFGVPGAKFTGYWEKPAAVLQGKDIYVSIYRQKENRRALAVISHIGKGHERQSLEIRFREKSLGFVPQNAVDRLAAPDPEYASLIAQRRKTKVPSSRAPLKIGDFGSEIQGIRNGVLTMKLDFHSFALIEIW